MIVGRSHLSLHYLLLFVSIVSSVMGQWDGAVWCSTECMALVLMRGNKVGQKAELLEHLRIRVKKPFIYQVQ